MTSAVRGVFFKLTSLAMYFLRLGSTGFGGPIALVGAMQRDLVQKRGWFSEDEFLEGLAFSQVMPGPLAAQLAIYLGFLRGGIPGASLAGAAFVLPSFVMVVALAVLYVRYGSLGWIHGVFYGVGAAVIGIMARSAAKLIGAATRKDRKLWIIVTVLAFATAWTGTEIIWLFLAGGLVKLAIDSGTSRDSFHFSTAFVPVVQFPTEGLLWTIFLFFVKSSFFVFGSGLAIIPFLHGELVIGRHWLTERQFLDAIAVAMITPGPVVITVAFIGFLIAGFSGAVAAACGVFLPVYATVIMFASRFRRLNRDPRVRSFVAGVTAAAAGAIAGAVLILARRAIVDSPTVALALACLVVPYRWKKIPDPVLVLGSGLIGWAIA